MPFAFPEHIFVDFNYQTAYNYWASYSNNDILKKILSKETVYNTGRLKEELKKLLQELTARKASDIAEPEAIQQLRKRSLEFFKKAAALHSKLELYPDNEQRKAAAFEILSLMQENSKAWEKIEEWQRRGVIPNEAEPVSADTLQQLLAKEDIPKEPLVRYKKLVNYKNYLSKAKRKGNKEKINYYTALVKLYESIQN